MSLERLSNLTNTECVGADSTLFDQYFLNERPNDLRNGFYSTNYSNGNNSSNLSVNSSYLSQSSSSSSSHSGISTSMSSSNSQITPQTLNNKLYFDERGLNWVCHSKIGKKNSNNGCYNNKKISSDGQNRIIVTAGNTTDQSKNLRFDWKMRPVGKSENFEKSEKIQRLKKAEDMKKKMVFVKKDLNNGEKEMTNPKRKVNDRVDSLVANYLHKYGLELKTSTKVNELTEFENTLYQNAVWKSMIKNPNTFKDLRGKISSNTGETDQTTKPI